jgi:hypothetical protein
MGGFFSEVLDVAGSFVGDPALGEQVASKAVPGFARITQTPAQIADQVKGRVKSQLAAQAAPDPTKITPAAMQIGAAVAPNVAAALASEGVMFPAGTVGGELQHPTPLDAFGGPNAKWVLVAGLALAGLLAFKEL